MGRRSTAVPRQLSAVSNTYVAATNSVDLSELSAAGREFYRVRLLATAAAMQRLYVVVSNVALSDAEAAAALILVTQRRVGYAYDISIEAPKRHKFTFSSPFKFVYFLSETGACVVDLEFDQPLI